MRACVQAKTERVELGDDDICDVGDRMFEANLLREKGNEVYKQALKCHNRCAYVCARLCVFVCLCVCNCESLWLLQ